MASTRGVHRVAPLCRGLLGRHRALSSGSGGKESSARDSDFDPLFADSPPVHSAPSKGSSSASVSTGESRFWKSLVEEPKRKSATEELKENWSFLQELGASQPRYSHPRAQTSSSSSYSFRKLGGDSGLDFLNEEHDRPASMRNEPEEQQESGEDKLLKSATFKLLRDSFQKSVPQPSRETKSIIDDVIGLDSSLFSSPDTWIKNVDPRSLAELEGGLHSTMDQSPVKDVKTYTFEELGEKLRQARPPAEQMLSSATGLSFGELRTRFQKIKQAEKEEIESKVVFNEYTELKESLNHLKLTDTKKQLSYEELAFVNHVGMRTDFRKKLEYTPPKDDLLTKYYSDAQLSSKERLTLEIKKLKEEFQTHDCDTGSPQVQIAILTARINNLNRHMREGPNYKRDKHSKKGLSDMVQYRKRMLRYLRRRDWPVYCNVLTKLKLDDVILEKRR